MKRKELEALIAPHANRIETIITKCGAPFGRLLVDGSLNTSQRRKGFVGRLYVVLGDTAPGWRVKDDSIGRKKMKTEIRAYLQRQGVPLAVHAQASYSSLEQQGSMMVRRDNDGKAIGVYEV